jgi:predicted DNA-binding helix-hairpin-helix protein
VDHLVRDYAFAPEEIVYDASGNLPLATDPKVSWALAHPERFPIDVQTASMRELLRVPGIGGVAARRLIAERRRPSFVV